MMGPGFGAAAGAYLLIVPLAVIASVCIGIGVLIGWLF
jgi:hypothetical protein